MTTPHVQSFILISMLKGQPKTPPSGDDLAVLDYHFKVKAYPIPGSFSKFKFLKTELNVDNGTNVIVKLTSHSYRIMINLSVSCYFELIWHSLRTNLSVFRFLAKCQDSPFARKPNSTI